MRNAVYLAAFAALVLSLPLSWWLAARFRRTARMRQSDEQRAAADRLAATAGFGSPPGGGP